VKTQKEQNLAVDGKFLKSRALHQVLQFYSNKALLQKSAYNIVFTFSLPNISPHSVCYTHNLPLTATVAIF
jgi:hypothetical protein